VLFHALAKIKKNSNYTFKLFEIISIYCARPVKSVQPQFTISGEGLLGVTVFSACQSNLIPVKLLSDTTSNLGWNANLLLVIYIIV